LGGCDSARTADFKETYLLVLPQTDENCSSFFPISPTFLCAVRVTTTPVGQFEKISPVSMMESGEFEFEVQNSWAAITPKKYNN
jgi:hypothetical protein